MNIPFGVLADVWVWAGWGFALLLLGIAVKTAPWHKVIGDREAQGVFLAAVLLVFALWSVKAGIGPGLSFHFIGATIITLMFGWQFALMLLALVMIAFGFLGSIGWDALGMNWVVLAGTPVAVTWVALKISYRYLPHHFFVYTFLNAFLVGALAMIITVLVLSVVLVSGNVIGWDRLSYQFLPMLPMMAAPEAFINGFIMTILVVYRVNWVSTFTDEQYLKGK
jgi:uncharacterized membrane protein